MRFLIYLFPATMDMVVAGILFVFAVRMADAGKTATAVTTVAVMWSITYMIFAQIAGKITHERNSAKVLIGSTILLGLTAGSFIFLDSLWLTYPLMILAGVGSAFFFAPFQVFMKTVETNHAPEEGMVRSTALYTFSWSTGFAMGPFVCGFIYQFYNWQACCVLFMILSFASGIGIQLLKHYAHKPSKKVEQMLKTEPVQTGYENMPDLVWLAWIGSGIGILACIMIRALFPDTVAETLTKSQQGIALALLSMTQGLTGLALIKSKMWMYKSWPLIIFGLIGLAGMILFGISDSFTEYCLAAIMFGIYAGSFYFYFVFHAIVHPEHSVKYVAINESIVGLAGLVGPLAGGILADTLFPNAPYLIFCVPVIGALFYQTIRIKKLG